MKQVLPLINGEGLYTKGIKHKDEAMLAMHEFIEDEMTGDSCYWADYFGFLPGSVTMETVEETRYWQCRGCELETIGDDNVCSECGEMIGTNGRQTFAFFDLKR